MRKKPKKVDMLEIEVNQVIEIPKQTAQQPNIEFTRTYFNVNAGTQKYLKIIPKILKDYVKPIS